MRIARVMGTVTLGPREADFPVGRLLLCEALDVGGVKTPWVRVRRKAAMAESLVVFDELGAGVECLIAVSEGREAAMPWWPDDHPVDAYCVAILDAVTVDAKHLCE